MGTDDFKKYCSSPWDTVILFMMPVEKLRPTSITLQLIVDRANKQCSIEEGS